jgi:hypothetical protein
MTLPMGYGGKDKQPVKKSGKGKSIAIGAGAAVAALVAIGALGATNQPNEAANVDAPALVGNLESTPVVTNDLRLDIAVMQDPIVRGSTQELRFAVTDDKGLVSGAQISVTVFYAGDHEEVFNGTTDETGLFLHGWEIGGNSNPGLFTVVAIATHEERTTENSTNFDVVEA